MLDLIAPFVDAGFALHWLHPRSKRPIGDDWSTKAVATLAQLRDSYHQGNNLGVRLGEFSRVGDLYLHVLDVDIRKPEAAEAAFAALRDLFPGFETFAEVQSGSGGASRHYYFCSDRPFSSRKLAHSAGFFVDSEGKKHWDYEIELFGTGKQVAMPPSIHPTTGKPYRWLRSFDFDLVGMGLGPFVSADALAAIAPQAAAGLDLDDDDDSFLAQVRSAPADVTDEQIRETLKLLPLPIWCEDRDGWVQVGMALHHQFAGSAAGLDLWTEFSKQSTKFNPRDQGRVWKSFSNKPNGVRFPTLLAAAAAERDRLAQEDAEIDDLIGEAPAAGLERSPGDGGAKLPIVFKRDKKGIEPIASNLTLALASPEFAGMDIRFDEFKAQLLWAPAGTTEWRAWRDTDFYEVKLRLERKRFKPISPKLVVDAVKHRAQTNTFDSAMIWIDTLRWDGASRVERFWIDYFGVTDTPYSRACGRYVWTALAGRVLAPGCQADMVPVICGPQGIGKSRGIAAMSPAPDFTTIMSFHESDVERTRKMRGMLVIELAELDGLKTRELETIKAWITRSTEHWTAKYEEMTSIFHRRSIIFATTNQDDFLGDPSGERRWLPMLARRVDVAALSAARDQLWAEGRGLFESGGVDWQEAQRLAPREHSQFRATDIWEDPVQSWLDDDNGLDDESPRDRPFITVAEVAQQALKIPMGQWKRADEMRIGKILASLGYQRTLRRTDQGLKPRRIWVRADQALIAGD